MYYNIEILHFHSRDIMAHFLECSSCNFVWRAYHPENCSHCVNSMGTPLVLGANHEQSLLHLIDVIPYEDMDNFIGIMEMIGARYIQAYWMYLLTLNPTENIRYLMNLYNEVFARIVEDVVPPLI